MTQIVVAQRMWQRRDTAAAWTSVNPVLAAGEIGVELGASPELPQKFKIGNGVTPWVDLMYGGGSDSGGSAWRDGADAPEDSLGNDGDYYLHNTTGDVYRRTDGVYSIVANIKGDSGSEVEMRLDSGFIQWRLVDDPGWVNLVALTALKGDPGPPGPSSSTYPTASFDGGSGDIAVGAHCDLFVPFGFEVTRSTLVGDAIGALQIDVRAASYAAFPPSASDSICGSAPPSLSGSDKSQDATLAGWTPAIASGSVVRFIVTACAGVRRATLVLEGVRS